MNRLLKKGISLVVVIAVMLSIASPALAEAITLSGSSIGYLALGDDISNGVGLNNPDTESYAVKIAQALYGAQWETSYKLRAGAGYRVEELRYLIDNDYNGDGYTEQFFGTPDTPFERDKRQGAVRADVSNADYITISAGVNNFSTYIVEQLLYYIENNGATRYSYDIGAVLDEVDLGPLSDYDVYDTIDTIKTIVIKELSAAVDQDIEKAIDLVDFAAEVSTYAVLSYIISFNEVIKEIHAINPDAEIYVIGLYNPAQDELLTLEVDGKVSDLEIGKCFETLIEMANAYTQILAPRKFDYTYVHPGNPQLLIDVMADKSLTIENRIPSALKKKLLNASEDTAVTLIQDMFKSYGIEKSYDEALDIAYEIFDAPTADDRLEVIYEQINDLAVDEVLKQFKKQLESFTDTYSNIQLTDQEVLDLLNDLREATATAEKTVEKVREEIATLFVVDLMYEAMVGQTFAGVHIDSKEKAKQVIEDLENAYSGDPDALRDAAADMVMQEIGTNNALGIKKEDVKSLLNQMDQQTDTTGRRNVVESWLNDRAADYITDKVDDYVPDYEKEDALELLGLMNNEPDATKHSAIAKEHLLLHFTPILAQEMQSKYEEGEFTLQNYDYFEEFANAINNAADDAAAQLLVRQEIRAAAAVAIYDYLTNKTTLANGSEAILWGACEDNCTSADGCSGTVCNNNFLRLEMVQEMLETMDAQDTDAQKAAALHTWLCNQLNGGNEPNALMQSLLFDPIETEFKSAYNLYDEAATNAAEKCAEYRSSVQEASDAFSNYESIKTSAAETIITKYEQNYSGVGEKAQQYYEDYIELRTRAVEKVLSGYADYQSAIDQGLESCNQLNEVFDNVFALLCEIAEMEKISLNDLLKVMEDVQQGGYIEEMVNNLIQGDKLAKEAKTVAYLALRYYLADSMMIMPSAAGHAAIAQQVIKAMDGEETNSVGGYYANKVVNRMIDAYRCAKAYRELTGSESGQTTSVINPHLYVALGDNITSGSALDDAALAYPQLVADALAIAADDRDGADFVRNYALNGMRAEELLMLVDSSYNGDEYTADRFGTDKIAALRDAYKDDIANAELITVNAGINNLTTYPLVQTMLVYNGEKPYEMDWSRFIGEHYHNKISAGKDEAMDLVLALVDNAESHIPELDGYSAYERCERALNLSSIAVESMVYGLVSYIFTLDDAVEKIGQMNPDATIALVGFYNPLEDTYFQVNRTIEIKGEEYDLSQHKVNIDRLGDMMVNLANRYLAHYVGNVDADSTAANAGSRLLNVTINDTEMFVTNDTTVSKDLSTLVTWKDFTLRGEEISVKIPAYFMKARTSVGDAMHPNEAGQQYIADQILKAVDFQIYADVIVEDYDKIYGDPDPAFEYLIDDLSSLWDIQVTGITRVAGEDVGDYALTAHYTAENGYKEIDEEFGQLHILKRTASVTVTLRNGVITNVTYNNVLDGDQAALRNGLAVNKVNGEYVVTSEDAKINNNYDLTITVEEETVFGEIFYEDFTLILDGVVYLNYYMSFQGFADDVDFANDGGVIIWTGSENPTKAAQMMVGKENCQVVPGLHHNANGWSARSNEIFAKNLGDLVFMRPYVEVAEGEYAYGPAKFYSPELYCRDQLGSTTVRQDTKAVCAALLEYGAAAQNYFDEETDNLVTEGLDLSAYDLTFDEALLDPLKNLTEEKDGAKIATLEGTRHNSVTFANATLSLEGAIILRVGYNLPADFDPSQGDRAELLFWTEDAYEAADTLAYDANTYSYKEEMVWGAIDGTACYVAGSDYIVAKALSETIYFSVRIEKADGTVLKGGINWYSPEMYVSDKLDTTNPELLEVIQTIAVYSEKARLRFQ